VRGEGLGYLFGRADRRKVVVVTGRGVEIPLGSASDWTVAELTTLIGEIELLPETPDRDSWSRRIA
jgi:hypothetical protein